MKTKNSRACDYRTGQSPDTEKGMFTLNSNRPVSGAGSGIVPRPDRVRRGEKGDTGEVFVEQGQRLPRVVGGYPCGVEWGG